MNNSEYFPSLNFYKLSISAKRWAELHEGIEKIVLCHPPSHFKYAIYAIGKYPDERPLPDIEYKDDAGRVRDSMGGGSEKVSWGGRSLEEMQADMLVPRDCSDFGIIDDLKSVYINFVPDDWAEEWIWFYLPSEGKLFDAIDWRFTWTLYPAQDNGAAAEGTERKELRHDGLQSFALQSRGELERLHGVLKKKVGFSSRITKRDEKLKDSAIEYFDGNQNKFAFVQREHLDDKDLYAFRDGHEKGDFIGGLLQKIFIDNGLGECGVQRCYKIFREAVRQKPT